MEVFISIIKVSESQETLITGGVGWGKGAVGGDSLHRS